MQREKTMSLGFEPISLSKTPPGAEVTAREMPENLHLHTCEGGFFQAITFRALENVAE